MKKKKELSEEMLINHWLKKYHNTDLKEVEEKHPEFRNNPRDFYSTYAVTWDQYNEWYDEFRKTLYDHFKGKYPKKYIDRGMEWILLNVAPSVKPDKKDVET